MRLENGLEHDLAENLLIDLAVLLGLGYHCRQAADTLLLAAWFG